MTPALTAEVRSIKIQTAQTEIDGVTVEDILRSAGEVLSEDNSSVLYYKSGKL